MDVNMNMYSQKERQKSIEAFSFCTASRIQVPCGRSTAQFWSSINIYWKYSLDLAVL